MHRQLINYKHGEMNTLIQVKTLSHPKYFPERMPSGKHSQESFKRHLTYFHAQDLFACRLLGILIIELKSFYLAQISRNLLHCYSIFPYSFQIC